MAKDVNIHVKTTGTQKAAQDMNDFYAAMSAADKDIAAGLNATGNAAEQMGAKSSRAAGWIKEAFTALVGPLGIAAAVSLVVAGVRKIIAAFDDMKKAAAEAVENLANKQRAAAGYFEAMDAYSRKDRAAAFAQAREVQRRTALPFESSMQLLEAQKRTFGEINQAATDQFAAYWRLHAGPQTIDLIRWMGASGINTPEQQGNIMRMLSVVADKSKLKEEEIITAISARAERLRYMGWSPEETITNIGKALSGLLEAESSKAMRGMLEAFEGFDEAKARKMRAPPKIAADEKARFEWLKSKMTGLPSEQRTALIRQAYGAAAAPYITKMLFEPTSPELQQALEYAKTSQAAAERQQKIDESLLTTEGIMGKAGAAVGLKEQTTLEQDRKAAIREYGINYIKFLQKENPWEYLRLKMVNWPGGEERLYTQAAFQLWRTGQSSQMTLVQNYVGKPMEQRLKDIESAAHTLNMEQRLKDIESAAHTLNIEYHHDIIYELGPGRRNPVVNTTDPNSEIGPRADRGF